MTFGYEGTRLWRTSLGQGDGDHYEVPRTKLRTMYHTFRERAALLAAEIPQDLRDYTVHDATHLDALWELADLIAGPEIGLTPTEGFVLGGAFLIHDLGMGLAAWPGGMTALMQEPGWKDSLAACLSDRLGRPAQPDELQNPPPDVVEQAKQVILRERHAAHAAELALINWTATGTQTPYYLVPDEDLRNTYGHLIGQIAASHWSGVDQLETQFPSKLGAPVEFPDEWTVDPLKLACLLRLADAAHIDARRAPGFLRAVRRPRGASDKHWSFQGHLQRPQLDGDRLIYTASQPFSQDEAPAWWLCYDALQVVDRELHGVDSLLADLSKPRMAARSVKGAESPFRLSTMIPTAGWIPVDARVVVSNVPALVRKLGGESLYGDSPAIALRELIQNASDASQALSALTSAKPNAVHVRLHEVTGGWQLDVADSGVGMSQRVLTGPLLDFGRSYWGSQLMREELSGLASSGFKATGRFGIGFYAIFMLGSAVRVVTRHYDEASADTRVLEFPAGLDDRPIVRAAARDERLAFGGTIVSVLLSDGPFTGGGLLSPPGEGVITLRELCGRVAPALPCDLLTSEGNQTEEICVRADDWKTMPGEELLRRIGKVSDVFPNPDVTLSEAADRLRTIERDGEVIARAAIAPSPPALRMPERDSLEVRGQLVAGGLASNEVGGAIGIFNALPTKADRTLGEVLVSASELATWASEQANLWRDEINLHREDWDITAALLARLNADMQGIHICCSRNGYMDTVQLLQWVRSRNNVVAIHDFLIDVVEAEEKLVFWNTRSHEQMDLDPEILLIPTPGQYGNWDRWGDEFPDKRWEPSIDVRGSERGRTARHWWYWRQLTLEGLILRTIAKGWGCELEPVLDNLTGYDERPILSDRRSLPVKWRARRPTPKSFNEND